MGSVGDLGILSYGMSKPVNAVGGGSLICNNIDFNKEIDKNFKLQKNYSFKDFLKSCIRILLLSVIIKPWAFKIVTIFFKKFSRTSNSKLGKSKKIGLIQLSFISNELKKINTTSCSRNENFEVIKEIIQKINTRNSSNKFHN